MSSQQEPGGGFIPDLPLSPPPSSIASHSSSSKPLLPHPRNYPLKTGSAKEGSFINYVDQGIQQVTRRHAKKFSGDAEEDMSMLGEASSGRGYESFKEVAKDIQRLLAVVWVSGTPSLQTPYLLSLALLVVSYIPSFPPAPRTMFRLLKRLDAAFAGLIQGTDVETGAPLPGLDGRRGVTGTEKVRIKSLVERTRVVVVEVMAKEEYDNEEDVELEEQDDNMETDGMTDSESMLWENYEMDVARVYEKTIMELGEELGGPSIGISGE